MKKVKLPSQNGFTLIELLIVIVILITLTTAVIVAVNPPEQLARGRDATRFAAIDQLGRGVQAYYIEQHGAYTIDPSGSWITNFFTAGAIKAKPVNPVTPLTGPYPKGCYTFGNNQNDYCYANNGPGATDAIVYALAESKAQKARKNCPIGQDTWIVWSSADGKTGLVCNSGDPSPGVLNPL